MTAAGRRRVLGVVLGLFGIVAGVGFAIVQLRPVRGAATPDAAARSLFQAVADGDFFAVAQSLVPAERAILLDEGIPVFDDLRRLGVLQPGASPRKLGSDGYVGRLTGFRTSAKTLRAGLVAVSIEAGVLTTTVEISKLPFGPSLRGSDGRVLGRSGTRRRSINLARTAAGRKLVMQSIGGRWGVSIAYSVAEEVRRRANVGAMRWEFPRAVDRIAPSGADTPENAVLKFFDGVSGLDVERVVAAFSPGEMGAAHDYVEHYVPGINESLKDLDQHYSLRFPGIGLQTSVDGSRAVVRIKNIGVDASLTQTDSPDLTVSSASGCTTVRLAEQVHRRCGPDTIKLFADLGVPLPIDAAAALTPPGRASYGLTFVVVREQGQWFVSPLRTMLRTTHEALGQLSKAQFQVRSDRVRRLIFGDSLIRTDPAVRG